MITKFADKCMELDEPWGFITFLGTVFVGIGTIIFTLMFLTAFAPSLVVVLFSLLGLLMVGLYITGLVKLHRLSKRRKKVSEKPATYGTGYGSSI